MPSHKQQQINGVQYQVTQPLNGEAATVRGVEVALQNQLRFLPGPLDGIGVYANYTFSDSTAHFPQHSGDSTLPGQSRHVGNLAASYEKAGSAGARRSTSTVRTSTSSAPTTRRIGSTTRTGSSTSPQHRRSPRNLHGYVNLLNLNDSLLRYFQSVPERVLQEEHYHWWAEFGVKIEF